MFQEDYKKAYEGIVPSERALNLLLEKAGLAEENRKWCAICLPMLFVHPDRNNRDKNEKRSFSGGYL